MVEIPFDVIISELPEWTFQFESNKMHYYRNRTTRELDGNIGDIAGMVNYLEKQVILQLEELVISHEQILYDIYDYDHRRPLAVATPAAE